MDSKREIKGFVGFQIRSNFHTVEEMERLLNLLMQELDTEYGIVLRAKYGIFPPGGVLWNEVRDSTYRCDIAIFDISENNPNVMVEVGLAYGFGKQVFLLKNRDSFPAYPVPSDLAAIYVSYDNGQLSAAGVVRELVSGILTYLQRTHSPDYYFRSLWGFHEYDSVLVICSELDEPEKRQHPEPNEYLYLSKYGDVDSLVEVLVTLHRLYPGMDVKFRSADEVRPLREEYTGNLILVGGPDYNRITRLFDEHSPFEYLTGEREEDIFIRHKTSGETHYPEIVTESGHSRIVDYGFFVKRRNPHNPATRLILIGGCHTYGVFGAIKAFSYWEGTKDDVAYQNCKLVVETLGIDPNFCALLEVRAIESSVVAPKVESSCLEQIV